MYLTLIAFLTFLPVAVSEHRSSPPSTQFLPAAVHHTAFPYGFQPDPNPPDSSLPKGSGVDEEFANRVRNRKAQEILQQELMQMASLWLLDQVKLQMLFLALSPLECLFTHLPIIKKLSSS